MIAFCPLAFGEVGVKDRIKSVLSYKKPAFWIILVALILSSVLAVCFLTNPASAEIGTLEDVDIVHLSGRTEFITCVWTSDGFSHHRVGRVSEELLQDLALLNVSKEAISANRSEDRDKSHTLVLQMWSQEMASAKSYLEGMYIHFNSDFTVVWSNNGVKPTLSYKVMEPERAKEVYGWIANYNISEHALETPLIAVDPATFANLDALKEKFPMYFNLDTAKGLQVYIWQMAENSYSCGLLPGQSGTYPIEEVLPLHKNSASLDEMRTIVAHYIITLGVAPEDVKLCPVNMPHSSYYYVIDDAYEETLYDLFWSPITATEIENPLYRDVFTIDKTIFDIDGDGKDEDCYMHYGPTSGLFTFSFSALEDGKLEYFNIFTCPWTTLSFGATEEGQGIIVRKDTDDESYLTLAVENGNIVLGSDEQDIRYWGEQGIHSPYASRLWEEPENSYFDSGPLQTIHGNLKTYYQNTDGTWQCEGYQYKYRLEITGRQPLAETDTTYVYLSNLESIPFERAMWASGLSSSLTQYFSYEEAMLVEILTVPTAENTVFKKAENGNLISPSGVEYRFLANEGILNYIGELEYVGDVEGKSSDPTSPLFALKGNDNVLIRWPEDSEWYAIYRKASLPPFQFTIDNCTRLEFLHFSELFLNSEDHIACNRGIVGQTKAQEFLFKVRLFEDPRDAGLYDLVRKPNGFLENCYLYGWLCGFFEEDPNLVVKMQVQSFNDLAYSIEIDRNEHVLANEFLQYLQSVSCPSELYTLDKEN